MPTTTLTSVKVLNDLIAICEDGAKGFAKAAEDVHAPPLHKLFSNYASQRAAYSAELKEEVAALGEEAEDSGHLAAAFHRSWMAIKEAVGSKDKVIIFECEAGENRAVKAYKEALEQPLPPSVLEILRSQFAGVIAVHNKLRDLKHSTN
jgi:uncharacterized protein (TIGR02284 family)